MVDESSHDSAVEDGGGQVPVDVLAEAFMRRLRSGEHPSIQEYVANYPDQAEEIRELFPTLAMLENYGLDEPDPPIVSTDETPQHIGDYQIIREVGRGGMGIVYEAEHEAMRRRVALKVLQSKTGASENHIKRFYREARAAGRLHHTNIVPVFEIGEHEGTHFYAMQFIRGQDLAVVFEELQHLQAGTASSGATQSLATRRVQVGASLGANVAHRLHSGEYQQAEVAGQESAERGQTEDEGGGGNEERTGRFRERAATAASGETAYSTLPGNVLPTATESTDSHVRREDYYHRIARIGLQVADALDCAHSQGILHRDIKPSNLILDTAGTVWITDFGLAKDTGDDLTRTGDIVGTLRYMAPERFAGEGDARSDIYGLGLTLYELATLQHAHRETDRARLIRQITQDEPNRPRKLDSRIPRDLETIILKAIDKHPARRYQKARQVAEDLRLFLSDRPIRARRISLTERVWRWCCRNPQKAALAVCVLLLLSLLVVGSLGFGFAMNDQATRLRAQARELHRSQRLATRRAYELQRGRAQAARWSGRIGQRFVSLDDLTSANELLPELGFSAEKEADERVGLRNQAIAALQLPDIRETREWVTTAPWDKFPTIDRPYARYAVGNAAGEILLKRISDGRELVLMDSPGAPLQGMRFAPGGRYLAARYTSRVLRVFDTTTGRMVLEQDGLGVLAPFDFGPGNRLAFGTRTGCTVVSELEGDAERLEIPLGRQPRAIRFSPQGDRLAMAVGREVWVGDLEQPQPPFVKFRFDSAVHALAWQPLGTHFIGGCHDGTIVKHEVDDPNAEATEFVGHNTRVTVLHVNHAGDRLVSDAWDGTIRFWDTSTGKPLLRVELGGLMPTGFGPADRQLAIARRGGFAIWEVARDTPLRLLRSPQQPSLPWSVDFDAKSEMLVSAHDGRVELWDARLCRRIAVLPATLAKDGTSKDARFLRDGSALLTSNHDGLQRWPIQRVGAAGATLRIGPPESLHPHKTTWLSLSRDGQRVAFRHDARLDYLGAVLDLSATADVLQLAQPHAGLDHVQLSPDGHWVATSTWGGSGVRLWDARTGQPAGPVLHPTQGKLKMQFRPDSRQLAVSSNTELSVWEVGSWKPVFRRPRDYEDGWPGPVAYSPDGTILAVAHSRFLLKFLRAGSGETLAMLDTPTAAGFHSCAFSPDGRRFAASSDKELFLWDVGLLRKQLGRMGLDWEPPALSPAADAETVPLQPITIEVIER